MKKILSAAVVLVLLGCCCCFWTYTVETRQGPDEQDSTTKGVDLVLDDEGNKREDQAVINDDQAGAIATKGVDLVLDDESNKREGQVVINDDQARAIAREAIGDVEFDEQGEIRVERLEGKIRVVFPVNKQTPPGTRYRGPDYAAEVLIDARSGKVLQALQGG